MNFSRYLSMKIKKYNRSLNLTFNRVLCTESVVQRGYVLEPLEDGYNPAVVEKEKYNKWEKQGRFTNNYEAIDTNIFSIVLPPPNVTGSLHLGHALTATLQDVLSRWMRMRGFKVTWLPGTDHAGIATQAIVEKHLFKKGLNRSSLGRENFKSEIWKWKEEQSKNIQKQLKKLGMSLDWSREVFTMDEDQSKAVKYAFIKLFKEGLIYKANNLINWSCALQSTISDIEVDTLNISGPTDIKIPGYSDNKIRFGQIVEFAYKLKDSNDEIVVATTRPETILGDVAVAVNPYDHRYTEFIGQEIIHPFTKKNIPIIADENVDKEFGTGALKITPAHDRIDYQIALKHNLRLISVINEAGLIENDFEFFSGIPRYLARNVMLKELEKRGLLRDIKPHSMSLPICSRSGDVIELLPRWQWYINCKEMAARALQSVHSGDLKMVPDIFDKTWNNWLSEEKDWCISRQLWWGHQIPAYKCFRKDRPDKFIWIAADSEEDAKKQAAPGLKDANSIVCEQDPDVLDTWFSSGLYPFSSWGWPRETPEMDKFYPLNIMITGHDILCFWVLRMVMLGTKLTGKLPFPKVLLHGVICDPNGAKMSKSKGNVIDPEDVINGISLEQLNNKAKIAHNKGILSEEELQSALEGQLKQFPEGIPMCGADALRFTLCSRNVKEHFIQFNALDCHTNKLFGNKIWQSLKYFRNCYEMSEKNGSLNTCESKHLGAVDLWILSRLSYLVQTVNGALEEYNFHIASEALKIFLYREMCDIYIECTKVILKSDLSVENNTLKLAAHCHTFSACFNTALRCLSPFMPYLTEELIPAVPLDQNLIHKFDDTIENLVYPRPDDFSQWRNKDLEKKMDSVSNIVFTIRQMKHTYKIANKVKPNVWIQCQNCDNRNVITKFGELIKLLAKSGEIRIKEDDQKFDTNIWSFADKNNCKIFLEVPQTLEDISGSDIAKDQLKKKKQKLIKSLRKLEKMVASDGFRKNASEEVQKLQELNIKALKEQLARLENLGNTDQFESRQ